MSQRLHVGNLPKSVTDHDLREFFAELGKVVTAEVVRGRRGIPRGFGYVELDSHEDAVRAIEKLNGFQVEGQAITVAEAQKRPRPSRMVEDDRPGGFSPRRSKW
jgi:RNA recognition motif-containing protein